MLPTSIVEDGPRRKMRNWKSKWDIGMNKTLYANMKPGWWRNMERTTQAWYPIFLIVTEKLSSFDAISWTQKIKHLVSVNTLCSLIKKLIALCSKYRQKGQMDRWWSKEALWRCQEIRTRPCWEDWLESYISRATRNADTSAIENQMASPLFLCLL